MHNLPNFKESLKALIASPSISSVDSSWDQGNLEIIQILATWFEQCGFTIDIHPVPHSNNKYNMLAKIGEGDGGLLLAGHSDTVPFDESRWQSDPLKLTEKNNKFYGIGTCDMKGFFAFILQVCKEVSTHKFNKPLYILATADEETTMAGARFFAEKQWIKPEVAIIGEPTNLVPITMHKGHSSHRIIIQGKAGHSSKPALGINAIEIMYEVIGALIALKEKLATTYENTAFDVPEPTLNLGAIKGGDNPNRICGQCTLDIDMRALPGLKDEELAHWLSESLIAIANKYPGRLTIKELHPASPSFEQKKPSTFVTLAEEISGHSCCAVNYATEAPFIQQLGCQTIVLGPGSIDQAHQPDEFLGLEHIDKTHHFLLKMIQEYCL